MPVIGLYLLKLSISLGVVWLFYQLVLRHLTFYTLNRWYLLGYSLLSFFIPLIDIGSIWDKDPSRQPAVIRLMPAIGQPEEFPGDDLFGDAAGPAVSRVTHDWTSGRIAGILLALGAFLLLVRLVVRWMSLRRIRRHATLVEVDGIRIYQVDEEIIPFSFGRSIYINQQLHTGKEFSAIILHEYVHICELHTMDMLVSELLCIVSWYNPFAWMIRFSIRQNLEFIADAKVLAKGLDKKKYQYHLLQVVGEPRYRLANNFNYSSLKKRIVMMNRIRSAKLHLIKFLFIFPLLAVLLVAFRNKYDGMFRHGGAIVFPGDSRVIAVPATGKPEVYDMDNADPKERPAFERRYGKLPDCVPAAFTPAYMRDRAAVAGGRMDTVPGRQDLIAEKDSEALNTNVFVDNVKMPKGFDWRAMDQSTIYTIAVVQRAMSASAGRKATQGKVVVTTKAFATRNHLPDLTPLFVVNGLAMSKADFDSLRLQPGQILSSRYSRDSVTLQYGEKALNGVMYIEVSPVTTPAPARPGTAGGEAGSATQPLERRRA